MDIQLDWRDVTILVAYLVSLAAIGVYFSKRQYKLEDFFLARRGMSWLPVGLSLMAALNSGIDYLGQPSFTIKFGLVVLVGNLSWFVIYPYVFFVTLPLFRRLDVFSAYEYLERRFNLGVRGLGAAIFMLWRLSWMATALYVPCLAIASVIGRPDLLVPMIITLGALVTFYTMLGGIKAVIWTDVLQFCIMGAGLCGTLLVAWQSVPGGVSEIAANATQLGTAQAAAAPPAPPGLWGQVVHFFTVPVSALGVFIAAVVGRLGAYTSDQVMVQRFQTTRSIGEARKGFLITAISDAVWMIALAVVGMALFAYFRHHPMPEFVVKDSDKVFPYFMSQVFPPGMVGLVIAAILAASLSSIDSAINSLTSVAMVDLYNRMWLGWPDGRQVSAEEGRRQVFVSRIITLVFGVLGIALSCNVNSMGTVFEIAYKLINGFIGPLLGIFLLGMFTRRANGVGVFAGGFAGTAVSLAAIWASSGQVPLVSFLWPSTFGLAATLAVGYPGSLAWAAIRASLGHAAAATGQEWTFREVLRRRRLTD